MVHRANQISLTTDGINVIFPGTPNSPIGIARVARVCLVDNQVIVLAIIIITTAINVILNPAGVHKGIILK